MNKKFQTEKVNDVSVKPVVNNTDIQDPSRVLGGSMFPNPYSNIWICSKKNSGKSSIIYNILKNCADKTTRVIIICPTVGKDHTYKKIQELLDKKNINFECFESLKTDEGEDILQSLLEEFRKPSDDDENNDDVKEVKPPFLLNFGEYNEYKEKKKLKKEKKKKKIAAELIVILDDLGQECRSKWLSQLCKTNRHWKAKVIISSQFPTDILPQTAKQCDYVMISRSLNPQKLEKIYHDIDLSLPYDTFVEVYKQATEKPYSFLWIDVRKEEMRENFSHRIIV